MFELYRYLLKSPHTLEQVKNVVMNNSGGEGGGGSSNLNLYTDGDHVEVVPPTDQNYDDDILTANGEYSILAGHDYQYSYHEVS